MIFVAFNYGAGFSAKRASPAHETRAYPLSLDLTDFSKLPLMHTKFRTPLPSQHLHTPFSILNEIWPNPCSLYTNIIKNKRKTILNKKKLNNVLNKYKYVFDY